MRTKTIYTGLPRAWHRQTLYDWGRRGLRTRHLSKLPAGFGRRPRSTWDHAWDREFIRVNVPGGRLIRLIGRMTREWVAVAEKSGLFWRVGFYLVPRTVYREAKALLQARAAADEQTENTFRRPR